MGYVESRPAILHLGVNGKENIIMGPDLTLWGAGVAYTGTNANGYEATVRPPFDASANYAGYTYRINLGEPAYAWGTLYAVGGVNTSSDQRGKVNTEPLPSALGLNLIKKLTPRRYSRKDEQGHPRDAGKRYTGLFAQELQTALLSIDIGGDKLKVDVSGVIQGFAGLNYIPGRKKESFTDEEKRRKTKITKGENPVVIEEWKK